MCNNDFDRESLKTKFLNHVMIQGFRIGDYHFDCQQLYKLYAESCLRRKFAQLQNYGTKFLENA